MQQLWAQVTTPAHTHTHTHSGCCCPEPSCDQGEAEAKAWTLGPSPELRAVLMPADQQQPEAGWSPTRGGNGVPSLGSPDPAATRFQELQAGGFRSLPSFSSDTGWVHSSHPPASPVAPTVLAPVSCSGYVCASVCERVRARVRVRSCAFTCASMCVQACVSMCVHVYACA